MGGKEVKEEGKEEMLKVLKAGKVRPKSMREEGVKAAFKEMEERSFFETLTSHPDFKDGEVPRGGAQARSGKSKNPEIARIFYYTQRRREDSLK